MSFKDGLNFFESPKIEGIKFNFDKSSFPKLFAVFNKNSLFKIKPLFKKNLNYSLVVGKTKENMLG